jgi:hypothetical protein
LILEIKRGEYSQDWVQKKGEELIEAVSYQKRNSLVLPAGPRYDVIEKFVIDEMRMWVGSSTHGYV